MVDYITMIAQGIYDAQEQAKYYYNLMQEEPDDDEWPMRYEEAKSEEKSYRDKYGYFNKLEDAIELLRASELQRDNHPDYSYEEQIEILRQAIEKRLKFHFLKKNYYSNEDAHKIVTALATTNFSSNKQFQDFISKFEPM